jgi:hypothetical protein
MKKRVSLITSGAFVFAALLGFATGPWGSTPLKADPPPTATPGGHIPCDSRHPCPSSSPHANFHQASAAAHTASPAKLSVTVKNVGAALNPSDNIEVLILVRGKETARFSVPHLSHGSKISKQFPLPPVGSTPAPVGTQRSPRPAQTTGHIPCDQLDPAIPSQALKRQQQGCPASCYPGHPVNCPLPSEDSPVPPLPSPSFGHIPCDRLDPRDAAQAAIRAAQHCPDSCYPGHPVDCPLLTEKSAGPPVPSPSGHIPCDRLDPRDAAQAAIRAAQHCPDSCYPGHPVNCPSP